MAQSVELDEPRVGKQTMLDRLGVRLSTTRWRGLGGGIDDKGLVTVAVRPVCDDRRQYFVLGPGRQSHYL